MTARPHRERLPGRFPPAHAALLVADDPHPVALTGAWAGVAAIATSAPIRSGQPFGALDELPRTDGGDSGVRVGGGWFGLLAYGLAAAVEDVDPPPPRRQPLPLAALGCYDHVLVAEAEDRWFFEALVTPGREAALRERRDVLAARLAAGLAPKQARLRDVRLRAPGAAGHRAAVATCRDRIAAGEVFQANLCLTLDATLTHGSPADLAATLAHALRPAHGAYVAGPWGAVASASPELFLRRTGRDVLTAPIKGTAPAGGEVTSAKDQAEHVMIVDLMRNDLGRVCDYGSVRVSALTEQRPGAGVSHLVSDVRGTLRDGVSDTDLLQATFPPGSVTGAPKVQALKVISDLEASGREAYTGAIGYASPIAGLELSVVIRTFEVTASDRVQLGVGGGITAGSDPDGELEECRTKATPLLTALGASWPQEPRRAPVRELTSALAPGRSRPDPARGIFETLRVEAGEPQRLEEHVARLLASAAALYDLTPDPGWLTAHLRAAAGTGDARLRVDLLPDGTLTTALGPLPAPSADPVRLRPVLLPGGLGAHKWADRRLLEQLTEELGGAVPLLADGDGAVLEAAWASVWLQEGDRLITPPADGRILPGVARAHRLESDPHAREEPVDLDRIDDADGLLVSTALRGLVPATLVA